MPIVEAFSVIADRHTHSAEGFPGRDILSFLDMHFNVVGGFAVNRRRSK